MYYNISGKHTFDPVRFDECKSLVLFLLQFLSFTGGLRGVRHEIKQRTRFRIFGILGKDSRFQKVFQIHLNIES